MVESTVAENATYDISQISFCDFHILAGKKNMRAAVGMDFHSIRIAAHAEYGEIPKDTPNF